MCQKKVTRHSLDQKMIGQHYGLQKQCLSVDLEDLHKNRAPRGQGFGSGITLFGILGASDLASGLGNITGASGYNRHAKRGKGLKRMRELCVKNELPSDPLLQELNPRTYAGRTPRIVSACVIGGTRVLASSSFVVRGAYFGQSADSPSDNIEGF